MIILTVAQFVLGFAGAMVLGVALSLTIEALIKDKK